jgi:hypothetical protein
MVINLIIIAALCLSCVLGAYLWRDNTGVVTNCAAITIAVACLILVAITAALAK